MKPVEGPVVHVAPVIVLEPGESTKRVNGEGEAGSNVAVVQPARRWADVAKSSPHVGHEGGSVTSSEEAVRQAYERSRAGELEKGKKTDVLGEAKPVQVDDKQKNRLLTDASQKTEHEQTTKAEHAPENVNDSSFADFAAASTPIASPTRRCEKSKEGARIFSFNSEDTDKKSEVEKVTSDSGTEESVKHGVSLTEETSSTMRETENVDLVVEEEVEPAATEDAETNAEPGASDSTSEPSQVAANTPEDAKKENRAEEKASRQNKTVLEAKSSATARVSAIHSDYSMPSRKKGKHRRGKPPVLASKPTDVKVLERSGSVEEKPVASGKSVGDVVEEEGKPKDSASRDVEPRVVVEEDHTTSAEVQDVQQGASEVEKLVRDFPGAEDVDLRPLLGSPAPATTDKPEETSQECSKEPSKVCFCRP